MTESSEDPDAAGTAPATATDSSADGGGDANGDAEADIDIDADTDAETDIGTDTDADTPEEPAPSGGSASEDTDAEELAALREQVEETYDFDNFGPADMAEMSLEEWEAAFDPETWIVGEELLDRVEQELNARVAIREIFAIVERVTDGEDRVIAYSDEGYAVIYADGSVEGEGTVLRDVKPTVALCSMESYDLMAAPEDVSLPEPREVVQGSGEFGNLMLQIVAGAQVLVGVALLVAWLLLPSLSTVVAPIAAVGFIVVGFFLFLVVANARLSDRFRAEEFRNRLRALEEAGDEWADVLPEDVGGSVADGELDGDAAMRESQRRSDGNASEGDTDAAAAGHDGAAGPDDGAERSGV
jgi:hypothetical protein